MTQQQLNTTTMTISTDIIDRIEEETDYDVVNWDKFHISVMDQYGSDDKTVEIQHYGMSVERVIELINQI